MTAPEARKLAEKNAPVVAKEHAKLERERAKKAETEKAAKHAEWRDKFMGQCMSSINFAVKKGETSTFVSLDHPWKLDYFQKEFEFIGDIEIVSKFLRKNGYTVSLNERNFEVDATAAYLNSGGECGRSEPYWSRDIVLNIGW